MRTSLEHDSRSDREYPVLALAVLESVVKGETVPGVDGYGGDTQTEVRSCSYSTPEVGLPPPEASLLSTNPT